VRARIGLAWGFRCCRGLWGGVGTHSRWLSGKVVGLLRRLGTSCEDDVDQRSEV
jgi:hypothetical protein